MIEAFQYVRPACDFAGVIAADAAVTVSGGRMFARNSQLAVCQPVEGVADFAVASSDIDLILRHVGECTISVKESQIIVKSKGERETKVKRVPPAPIPVKPDVRTQPVEDIDDLLSAIDDVFPFTVGDPSKPWSKGARFDAKTLTATNAIMLCRAELVSAWGLEGCTIPRTALSYIRLRGRALKRIGVASGVILMEFDDGGWARAACLTPGMPDSAPQLVEKAVPKSSWGSLKPVSPEYKNAFLATFALTDDKLWVYPDHVRGERIGVEDRCFIESDLAENVEKAIYKAQDLTAVISVASQIGFDHYPNPTPFVTARGSRGLIAGLKD